MFCSRVRSGFLRTIFLRSPEMTIIFVQMIEHFPMQVGRDGVACLERSGTPSGAKEVRREGHPTEFCPYGWWGLPSES
jgi:hypothetical protein